MAVERGPRLAFDVDDVPGPRTGQQTRQLGLAADGNLAPSLPYQLGISDELQRIAQALLAAQQDRAALQR